MTSFRFARLSAGVLVIVLLTATSLGWIFLQGQPAWYRRVSAPQHSGGAAARMEDKLILVYDRVARLHAWHVRHNSEPMPRSGWTPPHALNPLAAGSASPSAELPFQITFTDAELNAFFEKWADAPGRHALMDAYVDEPRVQLSAGKMILAGRVKAFHTVISVELLPAIDPDGQLRVNLARVYGGILPLPQSFWAGERDRLVARLDESFAAEQPSVEIASDGTANGVAAAAGMNRLVVATLLRQPAAPVLFLPYDLRHPDRTVPTQLQGVALGDGTIKLQVREMMPAERDHLLAALRGIPEKRVATLAR